MSCEEISRQLLCQSVALAAVDAGYTEASPECLDAMADVLSKLIEQMGEKAVAHAEVSGRVQPGILDVFQISVSNYSLLNVTVTVMVMVVV